MATQPAPPSDSYQSASVRRALALQQCYPGGETLSNQIRDGEANNINMGAKKAEFELIYGSPCQCHSICVH